MPWFKVDYEITDDPEWTDEMFTHGQASIDLINLARYKAGSVVLSGRKIDLNRGELAWSVQGLADRWKWSPGKVKRFLAGQRKKGRIVQRKSHVTNITQIVNYDRFTSDGPTENAADRPTGGPTDGPTDGPRTKKVKTKEGKKTSSCVGEEDSVLDEDQAAAWAAAEAALKQRGVVLASEAVAAGQKLRGEPVEVWRLVHEFDAAPGAWDAGALYAAVSNRFAHLPPKDPAWQREQQRAAAERNGNDRAAEFEQDKRERGAEVARYKQLDRDYGEELDAMTPADRDALLPADKGKPDAKKLRRFDMLEKLAGANVGSRPQDLN